MKVVCDGKELEVFGTASQEVYSTEEKRIGTWIDGKPLYRKNITGLTFQFNTDASFEQYGKTAFGIRDVIYFNAVATNSEGNSTNIPYISVNTSGNITICLSAVLTDDTLRLKDFGSSSNSKWHSSSVTVTIEYTKTTD